jgi:hypothetical protein
MIKYIHLIVYMLFHGHILIMVRKHVAVKFSFQHTGAYERGEGPINRNACDSIHSAINICTKC